MVVRWQPAERADERHMDRLKILMVTGLFPSKRFPLTGTFCAERARALARYADVRVVAPTPYFPRWMPGPEAWRQAAQVERYGETPGGIPVSYPRYLSVPKMATWSQGIAMARSVWREFRRRHHDWVPDVIDGHFAFPDGYAAVRLARRLGCPSLVTCHGSDLRLYPSLPFTGLMLRWAMRQADRVLSVSKELQEASVRLGCPEANAVFLPNGVDPSRFFIQDKTLCRRRLGLPTDGGIAICLGHLTDLKNQSVLIRALAEIAKRGGMPPHLVLVGEGPNRDWLKREAEHLGVRDRVHLVGQKPHAEVPDWIGAADWLMLSSTSEGWPTVYFEAMACGRPVLTSNVSSARDAVCRNDYGMVVEPNTPEAFADALVRAQARPFDAGVIRAYAECHSWDNWAQAVIQIIEDVRRLRSGSDLGGDSVA